MTYHLTTAIPPDPKAHIHDFTEVTQWQGSDPSLQAHELITLSLAQLKRRGITPKQLRCRVCCDALRLQTTQK